MYINSRPIINGCNLIIRTCYELGILMALFIAFLELDVHKFSKDPTKIMKPRHGKIVWDPMLTNNAFKNS